MRSKPDISASVCRTNQFALGRGWLGWSLGHALLVLPPGDCQAARRFAPSWGVADRRRAVFSRSSRRLLGSRETTHNKAVERTAAPLGRDEVAGDWTVPGFGERHGRAAVAHLGR